MDMAGAWTGSLPSVRQAGESWPSGAVAFLIMWLLMTAAMMAPSLLPRLWRYRQDLRASGTASAGRATAVAALGYFLVWTLVGVIAFAVGAVVSLGSHHAPAARAAPLAGGGVVLAAGLVQLTRWKRRRLACCRELHWRTATSARARSPLQVGIGLGVRCFLCCANLMAVLLVVGGMNLVAMVLTTLAANLERLAPRGGRLARAVGIVVTAIGLTMVGRSVEAGRTVLHAGPVEAAVKNFSRAAIRFPPPFRQSCAHNGRRAAMAKLVAIYKKPADVEAFERHYFGTHIPLAKKMPGCRKYEVSSGPMSTLAGPKDVFLIGTVYFDDLAAMQEAFASPEGRACAADRQLFAPDETGVQIFVSDTREV
jgi:uncharacterized protein (TIGR02118 family)